jgi:hypothetical protein
MKFVPARWERDISAPENQSRRVSQHGEAIAAMTVPFLARIGDSVGPPQVKEVLNLASRALSLAVGGKRPELSSGAVQL